MCCAPVLSRIAWKRWKKWAMECRDEFIHAGGREFHYIPCLNGSPPFIRALADLVQSHMAGWPVERALPHQRVRESEAARTRAGAGGVVVIDLPPAIEDDPPRAEILRLLGAAGLPIEDIGSGADQKFFGLRDPDRPANWIGVIGAERHGNDPTGQKFDSHRHQAISTVPAPEGIGNSNAVFPCAMVLERRERHRT
jgi:hypothetical protein